MNTQTAIFEPLPAVPSYAGRCRWTPEWKQPAPRDENGVCLCGTCVGRRARMKALKERQFQSLDDAYIARRYGKAQCDMSGDDWRIASVLKVKIRLERKLTSSCTTSKS
jgi:hypothetical protein